MTNYCNDCKHFVPVTRIGTWKNVNGTGKDMETSIGSCPFNPNPYLTNTYSTCRFFEEKQ